MKTPKQIEKLAETILAKIWKRSCLYPMVNFDKISIIECKEAIIDCVIQCQEYNSDKKYTIKEVERYHDIRATQGISNANKYIESLNK